MCFARTCFCSLETHCCSSQTYGTALKTKAVALANILVLKKKWKGIYRPERNYSASSEEVLWRRFLCVEHNQRQNRRICKAATIQPNSRLKYQPQKLHSWKHKCTTAMELTGNRSFWRANALRRDGRPWTFVSVIHRPQRKDSAKEKCSTFNKYVQCQNTRKE